MSKLLISPNLMFQFAVQIRELEVSKSKSEGWKLSANFAMPDLTKWLSSGAAALNLQLAWSERGIYLHGALPKQPNDLSQVSRMSFRFWIDTRGAVANKRFTKFCHLIEYSIDWKDKTAFQTLTNGKLDAVSNQQQIKSAIESQVSGTAKELELKSFIPSELLQGFQPREFPQISFFFDYGWESQPRINAGTDNRIRYDMDPSTWILARLV